MSFVWETLYVCTTPVFIYYVYLYLKKNVIVNLRRAYWTKIFLMRIYYATETSYLQGRHTSNRRNLKRTA